MLVNLQILLTNQTLLWNNLLHVTGYLDGPTLVFHDGSFDVDTVVRSLSLSRPVVVTYSTVICNTRESPSITQHSQQIPRSVVLMARSPVPIVEKLRRFPLWSARSRVIVIVDRSVDSREWLESLWRWTRAVDVVVMVSGDTPQFFTWFPYQPKECSKVTTIVKLNSSSLFPPKIGSHFNNCPLVAVTSPFWPLIVIDDFRGVEPRLFRVLAEKLGMTASYIPLPWGAFVWTMITKEGEPANGMALLWDNKADIMFSALSVNEAPLQFADYLTSHFYDCAVWHVPGPLPSNRTRAIFRAFSLAVWIWIAGTFAMLFATISFISSLSGQFSNSAFLSTLAFNLNIGTSLPSTMIFRMFAIAAYIYSMHITTAYQSSLIISLSDVPRERPMQTLQDLADSNLKIQFHESFHNVLDRSSLSPVIATLSHPDRAMFMKYLKIEEVVDRKNAMAGPKLAYSSMLREEGFYDSYDHPRVIVLKETFINRNMNFFVSKGHPLQPLLDLYIRYIFEAGIPGQYAEELTKHERIPSRRLLPFGLQNVAGAFAVYLSMITFSFLVWLAELALGLNKKFRITRVAFKRARGWLVSLKLKYKCRERIPRRKVNWRAY